MTQERNTTPSMARRKDDALFNRKYSAATNDRSRRKRTDIDQRPVTEPLFSPSDADRSGE